MIRFDLLYERHTSSHVKAVFERLQGYLDTMKLGDNLEVHQAPSDTMLARVLQNLREDLEKSSSRELSIIILVTQLIHIEKDILKLIENLISTNSNTHLYIVYDRLNEESLFSLKTLRQTELIPMNWEETEKTKALIGKFSHEFEVMLDDPREFLRLKQRSDIPSVTKVSSEPKPMIITETPPAQDVPALASLETPVAAELLPIEDTKASAQDVLSSAEAETTKNLDDTDLDYFDRGQANDRKIRRLGENKEPPAHMSSQSFQPSEQKPFVPRSQRTNRPAIFRSGSNTDLQNPGTVSRQTNTNRQLPESGSAYQAETQGDAEAVPYVQQVFSDSANRPSLNTNYRTEPARGLKYSEVIFNYLPQSENDPFPYPENFEDAKLGLEFGEGNTWVMAGASRRGLSHWHKGSFRDDAFALKAAGHWHILALADGAGSAKFSRVTANRSVALVIETIAKHAAIPPRSPQEAKQNMETALKEAIHVVHAFQSDFTQEQNLNKRDTYTTLLILVHQSFADGSCVFATFQIGDGYIMGMSEKQSAQIAQGDHGSDSGTRFVLSFKPEELESRILCHHSPNQIHTFLMASDGIEDDLKPAPEEYNKGLRIEDKFANFGKALLQEYLFWPVWEDWGGILGHVISYERQGSFDDRTLCILTLKPESGMYFEDGQKIY